MRARVRDRVRVPGRGSRMDLSKGIRIRDMISYPIAATPQQRCELVDCDRCVKAAATAAAAASTRIGTIRQVGREGAGGGRAQQHGGG